MLSVGSCQKGRRIRAPGGVTQISLHKAIRAMMRKRIIITDKRIRIYCVAQVSVSTKCCIGLARAYSLFFAAGVGYYY
jgi:hypothetical protein